MTSPTVTQKCFTEEESKNEKLLEAFENNMEASYWFREAIRKDPNDHSGLVRVVDILIRTLSEEEKFKNGNVISEARSCFDKIAHTWVSWHNNGFEEKIEGDYNNPMPLLVGLCKRYLIIAH